VAALDRIRDESYCHFDDRGGHLAAGVRFVDPATLRSSMQQYIRDRGGIESPPPHFLLQNLLVEETRIESSKGLVAAGGVLTLIGSAKPSRCV
jgi:hypothetical protein